ncbi:MAG: hypothetical protein IT430_08340 [Phycisphaerales bacterium]|nr:hypothetical protein [Phycisphaerales bacterium]
MSPNRNSPLRRLIGLLMSAVVIAAGASLARAQASPTRDDDPVVEYLERHGLTDLVIARLESRFGEALGEERIPLAERLAVLYGRMLDETGDDRERAHWERKSRDMLERVPKANTETLRLTIHKASYLRAERLAELHRLRRATDEERQTAARLMGEVAAAMGDSHASFRERIRRLESTDFGTSNVDSETIEAQLAELDTFAMQAAYYGGWARYYQAWLGGGTSGLDQAIQLFGDILQFDGAPPEPEDVPESMLSPEHAARAAIGIALCHAQAGRAQTGLAWLDNVQAANPQSPRVQAILPGYRLVVLFAAGQWDEIELSIAKWRSEGRLTTTLVRLFAVLALEQSQSTGDAQSRRLGEEAVNMLAQMGELHQVIEIADVFRLDSLGGDSFILAYVPAIKAYEAAREAHHGDEPATDPNMIALYAAAERLLTTTADRRDARQWPDAARHARLLVAWSQYFQGRLAPAASLFEDTSRELTGDEAESAMWMSIVCRERLASANESDPKWAADLDRALQEFVKRFPSSSRAGRVRFRQATADATPSPQAVEELLAIPPSSDAYGAARAEAERMLFLLFRDAPADRRIQAAQQYLEVAMPLLEADERRAFIGSADAAAREQYLTRARRVLDVLLTRGVARVSEARQILDRLETARAAGLIDLSAVAGELDYRRFQAQILSGGFEEAARWCEELWKSDPDSAFAQSASRALYTYAVQDWQTFKQDARLEETLRRVVLHGRRALRSAGDPPSAAEPASAAIMLNVADAALTLDTMTQGADAELRPLAESWFASLLEAQPRHFRVLRGAAIIAESRGRADEALQHWRTAMTGSPESAPEWYEARYHFMRLLHGSEPARAREVMSQHILLHPDYGPEPWGAKIRELHEQMKRQGGDQ